MKKLFFAVILALGFIPAAFAYGTCTFVQGVNGRPSFWNCPNEQYYNNNQSYQQPVYNPGYPMVPMQGSPGMYQQGGNVFRCSTASQVVGGLIGAGLGYTLGKNITISGHRLNVPGTIAGGVAGAQIACEYFGTASAPQSGMVMVPNNGQQMGNNVSTNQSMERTHFQSDCDIDDEPELQNLKGLSRRQCAAVAKLAASHGTVQNGTMPQTAQAVGELVSSRKQAHRRTDGVCFFSDAGPASLPPQCSEARSLPGNEGEYRSQWIARANAQ